MYYVNEKPFDWVIYGLHSLFQYFMDGAKFILEFVFMKIEPPPLFIEAWNSPLNAWQRYLWDAFGFADPTKALYPILIMTGYGFAFYFGISFWKWIKGIVLS